MRWPLSLASSGSRARRSHVAGQREEMDDQIVQFSVGQLIEVTKPMPPPQNRHRLASNVWELSSEQGTDCSARQRRIVVEQFSKEL
jgi:hypothetical protein